eukprot:TRINITY_DN68170_c1_g1_i1.p1 TRINITY_DN68170_c1_g1~~TRINITY_DN68170_c1_g1_i1.p1  ORF type:complete len:701 (+),score=65.32 TRINITY_DN68170_c1_g1_i1:78-2180(+)
MSTTQDLRTSCLNNEALICKQLRTTKTTSERRAATNDSIRNGEVLLNNVTEGVKFVYEDPYPVQKLMKECHLTLPVTELIQPAPRQNDFEPFLELWRRVETFQDSQPQFFSKVLESICEKAKRLVQEVRRSQVQINSLANVPCPVLDTMHDLATLPSIEEACSSTTAQMKDLEGKVSRVEYEISDQDNPTEEEVEQCEQQLTLRASLIDLVWDQLGILDDMEKSLQPFHEVFVLLERAKKDMQPVYDAKHRLRTKCAEDLAAVEDEIHRTKFGNEQGAQRYRLACERSDKVLKENCQRQEDCWKDIQELESKLQLLGEQRYAEVERRIEMIIAEEKRVAEINQQLTGLAYHKKLLENTLFNCNVVVDSCAMIEELVDEACTSIQYTTNKRLDKVDAARLEIHKRYLRYFTYHCNLLPLLINFNEINLEKIYNAMAASYKFTYLYRDRRAENERDLAQLFDEQKEEYNRFKVCMDYLAAHGETFVNPVEQLGPPSQAVQKRRYNLIQSRKAFSNMGEDDIDEMKEKLEREQLGGSMGEDTGRQPELFFSLVNPLATPRQLQAMATTKERERDVASPHSNGTTNMSLNNSISSHTTTTPTIHKHAHTKMALAGRPHSTPPGNSSTREDSALIIASPLEARTGGLSRIPDHPAVARRSVLSTRPLTDKRPGAAAQKVANEMMNMGGSVTSWTHTTTQHWTETN